MIVKLTKSEQKTLSALDPEKAGGRAWRAAREVAEVVFKSVKSIEQEHIRTIRNAFRRIVREGLVEMSAEERGMYRITLRGRKILSGGDVELDGMFTRGEATEAMRANAVSRMKHFGTKPTKVVKKAAKAKKAAKKAMKAEKAVKKIPKRASTKSVVEQRQSAPKKAIKTKGKAPKSTKTGNRPEKLVGEQSSAPAKSDRLKSRVSEKLSAPAKKDKLHTSSLEEQKRGVSEKLNKFGRPTRVGGEPKVESESKSKLKVRGKSVEGGGNRLGKAVKEITEAAKRSKTDSFKGKSKPVKSAKPVKSNGKAAVGKGDAGKGEESKGEESKRKFQRREPITYNPPPDAASLPPEVLVPQTVED